MNRIATKIFRFIFNVAMYSLVLICTTHYSYTNNPELFGIKNALIPYGGAMILVVLLSTLLAFINEVITLLIIKFAQRKKP